MEGIDELLESLGIIFTYEFDDFIHDRSILMDNGWKIVLGREHDIWQKKLEVGFMSMNICKKKEYVKVVKLLF